jgi:hypothetical protein
MSVWLVLGAALLTALATGLGALPLLLGGRIQGAAVGLSTALAAGFMLGASAGLFWEGGRIGIGRTAAERLSVSPSSSALGGCSVTAGRSSSVRCAAPMRSAR